MSLEFKGELWQHIQLEGDAANINEWTKILALTKQQAYQTFTTRDWMDYYNTKAGLCEMYVHEAFDARTKRRFIHRAQGCNKMLEYLMDVFNNEG